MAKSVAERNAEWRRRLLLKSSIFDDLNAERAARIRQAFPGDERPEVRAVVEFFANYPRCAEPPLAIEMNAYEWCITMPTRNLRAAAAARCAMEEITSVPVHVECDGETVLTGLMGAVVMTEVAEMRALGLWGRS